MFTVFILLQSVTIATYTEKMLSKLRIQTLSALLCQAEREMTLDRNKMQHIHTQLFHNLPSVRMVSIISIMFT
jgi:hypothetical protein